MALECALVSNGSLFVSLLRNESYKPQNISAGVNQITKMKPGFIKKIK